MFSDHVARETELAPRETDLNKLHFRRIPPFKKFKRFSFHHGHHGHQLLENRNDKEHKWIYLHRIPRPLGQNKPQTSHKILNYPFLFKPKKKNYLKPKVINSEIPGRDQDVKR